MVRGIAVPVADHASWWDSTTPKLCIEMLADGVGVRVQKVAGQVVCACRQATDELHALGHLDAPHEHDVVQEVVVDGGR